MHALTLFSRKEGSAHCSCHYPEEKSMVIGIAEHGFFVVGGEAPDADAENWGTDSSILLRDRNVFWVPALLLLGMAQSSYGWLLMRGVENCRHVHFT